MLVQTVVRPQGVDFLELKNFRGEVFVLSRSRSLVVGNSAVLLRRMGDRHGEEMVQIKGREAKRRDEFWIYVTLRYSRDASDPFPLWLRTRLCRRLGHVRSVIQRVGPTLS